MPWRCPLAALEGVFDVVAVAAYDLEDVVMAGEELGEEALAASGLEFVRAEPPQALSGSPESAATRSDANVRFVTVSI